jgi:hypothetical protein
MRERIRNELYSFFSHVPSPTDALTRLSLALNSLHAFCIQLH